MWNCGDTVSVKRLIITDTYPACLGGGAKLIPSHALDSHLGTTPPPPAASRLWRSKTGKPNEWFSLSLGEIKMLENLSNGEEAYSLSVRQFLMQVTCLRAQGHSDSSTGIDHLALV